jgi:uncharacterized protein (TIGR03000 family)
MIRHLAGTTLVAAVALALAPPAQAQYRGGGRPANAMPFMGQYGNVLPGGQYGWSQPGYGYQSYGWNQPGYGWTQQGYSNGYRSGVFPQYGAAPQYGTAPQYGYPSDGIMQAQYLPAGTTQSQNTSARVTVQLPANAKLQVDDQQSPLTGPTRMLVTPPLEQGKKFGYTLKAEWDDNGRPVTQERTVSFQAGQSVTVDFNQAAPKTTSEPVGAPAAPATPTAPPG